MKETQNFNLGVNKLSINWVIIKSIKLFIITSWMMHGRWQTSWVFDTVWVSERYLKPIIRLDSRVKSLFEVKVDSNTKFKSDLTL